MSVKQFAIAALAIGILAVLLQYAEGGQFKSTPRDASAVYAVHVTESRETPGQWNVRETLKLCPITPRPDSRGSSITFAAVSPSKPCPKL